MSGQSFIGLCGCAIGIALLVVTLFFQPAPEPRVVRVPVIVTLQPPPALPLFGPGGHPVEPK